MQLHSVASALPPRSFTQGECLEAMRQAEFWPKLAGRSRLILEKILSGDSGISKRHFALDDLTQAWKRNAEQLNNAYEREAPKLAAEAVKKAIAQSGHQPQDIDALFLCSCTGYLCPGVSSHLAETLALRPDVFLQDMTGLGCGAAIPLMRATQGVIANNPESVVITVAVEICSAAFYVEDDFGVLISTCLFGDGASAAVWSGSGGSWEARDFTSLHIPEEREKIRFTNAGGHLRNQLERSVPQLAGQAVQDLYSKRNTDQGEPQAWVTHGGGRDVIEELESVLPVNSLPVTREVMNDCVNMSSPSVFLALEKHLEKGGDESHLWMTSFGAGFSAHACQLYRIK